MSNVDLHNHVIPPTIIDAIAREPGRYHMKIEERGGKRCYVRDGQATQLAPVFYDAEAKVEAMDRIGMDIAALSAGPPVYFYWLEPDAGLTAARLINDGIAQTR